MFNPRKINKHYITYFPKNKIPSICCSSLTLVSSLLPNLETKLIIIEIHFQRKWSWSWSLWTRWWNLIGFHRTGLQPIGALQSLEYSPWQKQFDSWELKNGDGSGRRLYSNTEWNVVVEALHFCCQVLDRQVINLRASLVLAHNWNNTGLYCRRHKGL